MLQKGISVLAMILIGLAVLGCDSAVETEHARITIDKWEIVRPGIEAETQARTEKEIESLIKQNDGKLEIESAITIRLNDKEKLATKEIKEQEAYLPFAFDVSENGDIFVLYVADNMLVVYSAAGEAVEAFKISGMNIADVVVSRSGETICLINRAGNILLVMDQKGEMVYQGRPPRLFEGSDLDTLTRVFVVDESTIAFVDNGLLEEALSFNLKKNKWESIPHFTTHGRDGKFYLFESNKITWWDGIGGFEHAEVYKNDTLFIDGLAGLFGVDERGYTYRVMDVTSETFTKEYPDCIVFIDEPLVNKAAAIKLPFGHVRLGYDGAAYVAPYITKNHVSAEIPIYRIKFGSAFKMEKVVPHSHEQK